MLRKEWNRILDEYLKSGRMRADDYTYLNEAEKEFINELKKSFKRIKNNENISTEE